jgi:hypothetical protein
MCACDFSLEKRLSYIQNFVPLSYTRRICDMTPYNAKHGKAEQNVPIIKGDMAYTSQEDGQTSILIVKEGLWFGPKLSHSLLNQNQLQYNGVMVWDNPFDGPNPISIEHLELTIPLHTSGMNIFLDTRTPTQCKMDSCPHIELLTCDGKWNPQSSGVYSAHGGGSKRYHWITTF